MPSPLDWPCYHFYLFFPLVYDTIRAGHLLFIFYHFLCQFITWTHFLLYLSFVDLFHP